MDHMKLIKDVADTTDSARRDTLKLIDEAEEMIGNARKIERVLANAAITIEGVHGYMASDDFIDKFGEDYDHYLIDDVNVALRELEDIISELDSDVAKVGSNSTLIDTMIDYFDRIDLAWRTLDVAFDEIQS